jgi:hypothetical protein
VRVGSGKVTEDMLSHNRAVRSHMVMIMSEGREGLVQVALNL